jgi:mRNA-degrading endonuclease YafQ of YafQ-DinJ toxin-antitoxin module
MNELRAATKYRRDVRRCNKRGLDIELLIWALELLEKHGELPAKYGAQPAQGRIQRLSGCAPSR